MEIIRSNINFIIKNYNKIIELKHFSISIYLLISFFDFKIKD